MATRIAQENNMSISVTVKNTFLDVKRLAEDPVRLRSSSVPRAFKPTFVDSPCSSDDSTNASDKGTSDNFPATSDSEQDFPDCCSDCTDITDDSNFLHPGLEALETQSASDRSELSAAPPSDETPKSRVTLSLSEMVTADSQKARAKLRAKAVPFKSVRTPPADALAVIGSAVEVLSSFKDTPDVQVQDGGMGGTTMIVAKCPSAEPETDLIFALVKDALLNSAEQSENTYIMGYGAQPFNTLHPMSFSCTIGCVPAAHKNTCCWDAYEQGLCPRCTTCRWEHPTEVDTMRVIIMIKTDA